MTCPNFSGARLDDVLQVTTRAVEARGARIIHEYEVRRGEELIAEGRSTVACIDKQGRVARLPKFLLG